jgi:hypothetical protein
MGYITLGLNYQCRPVILAPYKPRWPW